MSQSQTQALNQVIRQIRKAVDNKQQRSAAVLLRKAIDHPAHATEKLKALGRRVERVGWRKDPLEGVLFSVTQTGPFPDWDAADQVLFEVEPKDPRYVEFTQRGLEFYGKVHEIKAGKLIIETLPDKRWFHVPVASKRWKAVEPNGRRSL